MMELLPDARRILRYAWSVRWTAAAAIFSGAEVALPLMGRFIAPGRLALLAALCAAAAFVSRFLAQKNMQS